MDPIESCEVCGTAVTPDDAVRAEVSIGDGAMCPTPMSFHSGCYEQAMQIWQQPGEALCAVDPEFPETAHWLEQSRQDH